jgi:predicted esterase
MTEHFLKVEKTARYVTSGELNESTTHIWIAVHGYAQLASYFIKDLQPLLQEGTYIVAPEALSRFYPKGFFGNVGATWMTKEDRLHEIADYVAYLDKLYYSITANAPAGAEINILGFSQGCATVCRWIQQRKPKLDCLWLCSGDIPGDLVFPEFNEALKNAKLHILLGKEDGLVSPEQLERVKTTLEQEKVPYELHLFDGGHVVNAELIGTMIRKI